ncbi:hypothetical protein GFY24_38930 [Nocardia sp. SYP-A9097]|uniref:DUF6036 family nucleotidyltransferase n=1 Tax=Nocardia sp. SYP-A9097 TaxID=2663237 RepID=UPI001324A295|nr:DUF6036 family nucleotidyltransferase [Nocardia sp. SYP-A9097]MRH93325.1 hypothetical protein [Nocardia sp. SYP-A9097]
MNREQFTQAIRTACTCLEEPHVVIFGSQSILGSFDEDQLPEEASRSREVDMIPWRYFNGDLTEEQLEHRFNVLETFVGEDSPFHHEYGIYVEAVHKDTVILPHQWDNRLVRFEVRKPDADFSHQGLCLDPIDLCVAKSIAGRPKDHEFVRALIEAQLIEPAEIRGRIDEYGIEWPAIYSDEHCDLATTRALNWLNQF